MDYFFPSPILPRRRQAFVEDLTPALTLRVISTGRSGNREYTATAEMEGRLVGLVSVLHPEAPASARWYRQAAMMEGLVIMPSEVEESLEVYLIRHAEAVAREWGAHCICVRVPEGNMELAASYRARGFYRDRQGDRAGRRPQEAFTKPLAPMLETIS
jgi:hypothetical protein